MIPSTIIRAIRESERPIMTSSEEIRATIRAHLRTLTAEALLALTEPGGTDEELRDLALEERAARAEHDGRETDTPPPPAPKGTTSATRIGRFKIGDRVLVRSQEAADRVSFFGPLDGVIAAFSHDQGALGADLARSGDHLGRWIPLEDLQLAELTEASTFTDFVRVLDAHDAKLVRLWFEGGRYFASVYSHTGGVHVDSAETIHEAVNQALAMLGPVAS